MEKKVLIFTLVSALVLCSLFSYMIIGPELVKAGSTSFCELKKQNPDLRPYLGSELQKDILENNPEAKKDFVDFYSSPLGKVIMKEQIKSYSKCMN